VEWEVWEVWAEWAEWAECRACTDGMDLYMYLFKVCIIINCSLAAVSLLFLYSNDRYGIR
jgi:hypothetical protein